MPPSDPDRLPYPGPPADQPTGGPDAGDPSLIERVKRNEVEIARLKADNAALRESSGKRDGVPGRTRAVLRSVGAGALIVLALLFGVVGNVAVWVKDVALDTNEFEAVVGPLSKDPAVGDAVSRTVVDELLTATNARARSEEALDEFLPSDVRFLSGAIVTAVENTLTDAVRELVASDQFNALWRQVTTVAHEQLVRALLADDSDAVVRQQGEEVVLDLRPIIEAAQSDLPSDGIGGAIANAPIPAGVGVFTIAETSALGDARNAAQALDALGTWIPIIALVLLVGGIALARRRRQATIASMIAFAVLMLVTLVALRIARSVVLNELDADSADRSAARVIWDAAVDGLRDTTWVLLVAAALVAFGTWLSGPSGAAATLRRWFARSIRVLREHGGITLEDTDPVGRVVRPHKNAFRLAGVVVGLLVLVLIPGLSILDLILAAVFLVLYLAAIEFVAPSRRRGRLGAGGTGSGP